MPENKKSKTITWGKRLVVVLLVLAGMFYGILNLAERSKDSIRLGLQDYITQATGHKGVITDMVSAKLTPDVSFRMNGVFIIDKNDSKKTLLSAEKSYFSIPFWNMLFGIKKYIGLELINVEIASGYLLPQKISISFAGISDPSPDTSPATFVIDGFYNKKPLLITLELDRQKKEKYFLYALPSSTNFTFKIGNLESDGVFEHGHSGLAFKKVQVRMPNGRSEFVFKNIKNNPLFGNLEGTINDVLVTGSLNSENNIPVLQINLQNNDKKSNESVEEFLNSFKKEIGIGQNDKDFKIDLSPITHNDNNKKEQ